MKIEITRDVVRNMAKKLKEATFPVMSFGQSLEASSRMLGYPNWDTLSGLLKAEEKALASQVLVLSESEKRFKEIAERVGWSAAPPKLEKPFTLVVAASNTDEFGDSPEWAKVEVNQEFVNSLHKYQTIAIRDSLDASINDEPNEWGGDLRYAFCTLEIDKTCFYFRAAVKHSSEYVETRSIEIKEFFRAIENPRDLNVSHMGWADGVLFSEGNSAKKFARYLLDMDVVDINEGCIDQMLD